MRSLIEQWHGHAVVTRYDRLSGTWMFIAMHDVTLGAASGGTRMKVYPTPEDGLVDAMRLAEGMTYKWAVVDLPSGGGKGVLAIPRPFEGDERRALLRRYAHLVESLHGGFSTGVDLGTSIADMMVLRGETRWVHGVELDGSTVDAGAYTAQGVLACIRSAVREVLGTGDLNGRSVLVQGLGGVGGPLVGMLQRQGARVLVNDVDAGRLESMVAAHGVEVVPAERVYSTPCDVYSPCAVGATLNQRTVPELRCKAVAGSANNQLEGPQDAERLRERGILYAPDYVVNAGAAMVFGLISGGLVDHAELGRRVDTIGDALTEIFHEAAARGESPVAAADRRVRRILARGPLPAGGS